MAGHVRMNVCCRCCYCCRTRVGAVAGRSHSAQHVRKHLRIAVGPSEGHTLSLVLHATVLEPDFDGALGQVELRGQLTAPGPGHVVLFEKLVLQTVQLLAAESGAVPLRVGFVLLRRAGGRRGGGGRRGRKKACRGHGHPGLVGHLRLTTTALFRSF